MKHRGLLLVGLFGLLAFGAAVLHLLALRFEAGDVYPLYSSLRADPLGTRALHESLDALPGITATRNFEPLPELTPPRELTLALIGTSPTALTVPHAEATALQAFVLGGGRLVISFEPSNRTNLLQKTGDSPQINTNATPKTKSPGNNKSKPASAAEEIEKRSFAQLPRQWGFELGMLARKETDLARVRPGLDDLPSTLPWHSTLVLTNLHASWAVLYERSGHPVLAERKLGAGSIVLATDSYFMTNEALWKQRQPALLARLLAQKPRVIFDETHLGVADEEGVATLARKYRLHGVVAALLVCAGLFVWRQATPFLPTAETESDADNHVAGRDAAAGFVNLLRRSIPRAQLLRTCLAEWEKSFAHPAPPADRLRRAHAALATDKTTVPDPVRGYAALQQILTERK